MDEFKNNKNRTTSATRAPFIRPQCYRVVIITVNTISCALITTIRPIKAVTRPPTVARVPYRPVLRVDIARSTRARLRPNPVGSPSLPAGQPRRGDTVPMGCDGREKANDGLRRVFFIVSRTYLPPALHRFFSPTFGRTVWFFFRRTLFSPFRTTTNTY